MFEFVRIFSGRNSLQKVVNLYSFPLWLIVLSLSTVTSRFRTSNTTLSPGFKPIIENLKGGRGDLVAEVKIVIPENMNDKERELFKELRNVSNFEPRKV